MPFSVRFDDITEYNVDAIVNSLGVKGRILGSVCRNILEKSKDDYLKDFIKKQNNPVGTILITESGKLPCNNIIHIVTPFKKDDDYKNTKLVSAYTSVLRKAIELGYKSIALPFIGTGANGYDENDAYEAVMSSCALILEQEEKENKDILDITLIAYLKKQDEDEVLKRKEREEILCNENISFIKLEDNNFSKTKCFKDNPLSVNIVSFGAEMGEMNKNELLIPSVKKYYYPYDFVEDYLFQREVDEKIFSQEGLDRRRKNQMKTQKNLKKIDVYRLAFMCKMNKTEILQFMVVAGHCFSPLDSVDVFFIDYINGIYGNAKSLYELTNLAIGKCDAIFTYSEK